MATKESDWSVGVEILAGSHVIAIVNRVQSRRLDSLKRHPVNDDPQRQRAREVAQLEGSLPEALERAKLMVAAPALLNALHDILGETWDCAACGRIAEIVCRALGLVAPPAPPPAEEPTR